MSASLLAGSLDPAHAGAESVALVTGGAGGIGLEVSRQLLDAGLTVLIGAREPERARGVVDQLGARARLVRLDVTDPASVDAAVAEVTKLDVLVNNAGVSFDTGTSITEADADLFRRTYETNVFGVITVSNAVVPLLRRSAHPRIVNVSSGTGSLAWSTGPNPQFDFRAASGGSGAAYRSSKAALNALTVFYAQALGDHGIKVNALAPGVRATNLNSRARALGGDPAEAAAAVVRLALLPDDGPTGELRSWDGGLVPW